MWRMKDGRPHQFGASETSRGGHPIEACYVSFFKDLLKAACTSGTAAGG
jgi:hypothetical protein